jgi:ParB family chromosome partitioning protein
LLELALVENIQRADLNALEEGQAYQTLRDEFGLKDEDIARRVGKSRVAVVNARRLIKLIPQAQQALLDNTISAGHGRALLRFEEPGEQLAALDLITRREISVRESERLGELAQNTALGGAARHALLAGQITPGQAQALLRIDDAAQQVSLLDQTLTLGLSSRETEQVADLVAEGVDVAKALSRIREGAVASDPAKPPVRALGSAPAEPQPKREQAAEDAASQRMFEEALATPVQLARSGSAIKLTITFYDDEQLQQFYDLVAGM